MFSKIKSVIGDVVWFFARIYLIFQGATLVVISLVAICVYFYKVLWSQELPEAWQGLSGFFLVVFGAYGCYAIGTLILGLGIHPEKFADQQIPPSQSRRLR